MLLGKGSYGQVVIKNGRAVKKFSKIQHLIQEYAALKYLDDCEHVVSCEDVDFENLELHMTLYDCGLDSWLEQNRENKTKDDIKIIIHDILIGLIELHDRGLTHGDLKPGNILVNKNPLRVVLGDCGFVSISKYAKVRRTAPIYRDPVIQNDQSHDLFSLGICMLEIVGNIRIVNQRKYKRMKKYLDEKLEIGDITENEYRSITINLYDQLHEIIDCNINDEQYKSIICDLVQPEKTYRPTARAVLYKLYGKRPTEWIRQSIIPKEYLKYGTNRRTTKISIDARNYIKTLIHTTSDVYSINRSKKGYGALLTYLDDLMLLSSTKFTNKKSYRPYVGCTLLILVSIFGQSNVFKVDDVIVLCEGQYNVVDLYSILNDMLSNKTFLRLILDKN